MKKWIPGALLICGALLLGAAWLPAHAASLDGLVFQGELGLPIPGTQLAVFAVDTEDSLGTAVSDDIGYFHFPVLPEGEVRLFAWHPAYYSFSAVVVLQPGENRLDVSLQPLGQPEQATLEGTVMDAVTGLPLGGAQASWSGSPMVPPMLDVTDSQGQFLLDGLFSGPGVLTVVLPGHLSASLPLILSPGANSCSVGLQPLDTDSLNTVVFGTVRDLYTRLPIPDAPVQAWREGVVGDTLNLLSGPDGSFVLTLPFHSMGWWLGACVPGYECTQQWIYGGMEQVWVELILQPENHEEGWGVFSGRVTRGDAALEGAELEAINLIDPAGLNFFAQSDRDGFYNLPAPAGEYALSCRYWLEDGQVQTLYFPGTFYFHEALPLPLPPEATVGGIDFNLPLTEGDSLFVFINGRVSDEAGQPLAGVRVRVWTPEEELVDASVLTDGQGVYQTVITEDRLPIVPFSLSAELDGYQMEFFSNASTFTTATQFQLGDDSSIQNVDFQLQSLATGVTLSGQVETSGGGAALVAALNPAGGFVRTVSSAPDGSFLFPGLPEEELVLLYYAPGHLPVFSGGSLDLEHAARVSAQSPDPLTAQLATQLPAAGPVRLVGRVESAGGEGLQGALIIALTAATGDLRYGITNLDGQYQIEGLAANADIRLLISQPGYQAGQVLLHTDNGQQQTQLADAQLTLLDETELAPQPTRPSACRLAPNSPNPFNPSTMLSFTLDRSVDATLSVFDLRGALIWERHFPDASLGEHQVRFDGTGLASGLYLVRLEAGGRVDARSILLLK